jgi:hypothetical protein
MGPVRARVKVARMKFEITQLAIALERVRNELGGGDYPPDGADLNTNSTSGGTPMDVQRWCRRAFPATLFYDPNNPPSPAQTGNYVPFPNVTPDTALVFWLGGIRDPSGAMMGFSADPANPFDISFSNSTGTVNPSLQTLNPSRIGPFFDFDKTRVMPVTVPAPASRKPGSAQIVTAVTGTPSYSNFNQVYAVYFPQNDLTITNTTVSSTTVYTPSPYLYFKAVAAKYSDTITSGKTDNSGEAYHVSAQGSLSNNLIYVTPLKDAKNAAMGLAPSNSTRAWMNPRSYQILCAGLDGFFGKSTTGNFIPVIATSPESKDSNNLYAPIYPDGLNYDASISGAATKNTPDDITNFSNGKLSDDAP